MRAAIYGNKKTVDAQVMLVIDIYNTCQEFHSLPVSGGLFAQDSYLMYLFGIVREARLIADEIERKKAGAK